MKLIFLATLIALVSAQRSFLIGSGIADVTGECAEGGFMGYAQPQQKGAGIHVRPRARAFVIGDSVSGKVVAYVSVDLAMGVEMVKLEVVEKLQALYGSSVFSGDNILISGTHTHSTPGGIGGTALLDIANLGFNKVNYEAAVNGLVRAISQAYDTRVPGSIAINRGQVDNANINRSPASYLRDPDDERARYQYNTDHDMTLLKFVTNDKREIGEINFFAVHGTSMNNTNSLISGDNKGYAAQMFEKDMNPGFLPGKGPFVAAFGQSNEGDVSPNTKGPKCPDGSDCDFVHSTCGNPPRTQGCIASGPGRDMFESTQIIGQLQYQAAKALYNSATQQLNGSMGVNFRHWYVDMQNVTVNPPFSDSGQVEKTCQAGLGYAFAGGTTDGPGDFDFTQGTNGSNPFWDFLASFIAKPTPEQKACQAPKPILLDVGLTKPIPWVSYILPMQVLQFGQVWILGVPAEFTTMAGRRLRNTFYAALKREGALTPDTVVIIAGLSNSYSHYVTTFQEYQLQRYEGASTLYGPHTLAAYLQIYDYLATQMARGLPVPAGPAPIDMRNRTIPSFLAPNPPDTVPSGTQFGDVYSDCQPSYKIGQTAVAVFWGGNPRNDIMTDKTYLTVEMQDQSGQWAVVNDDASWDTKFKWAKVDKTSQSRVTVEWTIPTGTPAGTYRLRTFGNVKDAAKKLHPYTGTSRTFTVS